MKNDHPADEGIQQFVLHKTDCDQRLIDHIAHCPECQRRAKLYVLLRERIEGLEKPVFEFNLTAVVMSQLSLPKYVGVFENVLSYVLVAMAGLWVGLVYYLIRPDLVKLVSALSPMFIYFFVLTAGGVFFFLLATLYADFQQKLKTLTFR
ncbi:hypothetical protein [Larkinella rosea]|uniref:Zinc-finger domain-containing protein n=1 Tax=Larkinella rosea TaxID=2025312 RepID=A0A3P1BJ69_9BACT|nr:hypothetical protein [Larkinella rosea]RRB01141.1 hypothetical protein EHT25_23490 [Larkinella rosea]